MATLMRHLSPASGIIHRPWSRTFFRFASPATPAKNEETEDMTEGLMACTKLQFVCDSAAQMKLRRLNFDVEALKKVAVKASGSTNCSDIKVLAEGTFNRVFSLTMDAGIKEIIVKMPFPHAGPEKLLTNSEVATMDFVRTRFNAPVPKVLAWDPSPYNEVGNEYIIMEKLPGQHSHTMHEYMDGKEAFVKDIAKLCTDMASVPFSQYGSIYYKEDVETSLQGRSLYAPGIPEDEFSKKFRIGPSVKRQFYADGRASLSIDRGPWRGILSYMNAHAQCEIAWIKKYASSRKDVKLFVGAAGMNPKQHTILIEKWMGMLPAVLPQPSALSHMNHCKEPHLLDLNKPTLMHTDLRSDNIFVTDDINMTLSGLIDFQSVSVRPAFEARLPPLLPWHPPVKTDLKLASQPPALSTENTEGMDDVFKRQAFTFLEHLYRHHPALYVANTLEYLRHLSQPSIRDTWSTWQEGLSGLHTSVRHLMNAHKVGVIPTNPKHPKIAITFKPGEVELMDRKTKVPEAIAHFNMLANKTLAGRGVDPLDYPGVPVENYEVVQDALQGLYMALLDGRSPEQTRVIKEQLWRFRDGHFSNYPQSMSCR